MGDGMEFVKWLHVQTDSAASARAFFGCAADWPAEVDPESTLAFRGRYLQRYGKPAPDGLAVYRVLSSAWLKQQRGKVTP